ncbi:hypothetical protein HYDPIDRAFT_163193 [Hydnomerulius pinastri MD-312]|uniref:Heterokaryon incompatibility domain-containing protein n=1 Tax=Hydnomerulius pinastri MD-312 TaxID=994086 RepID=A0A0C9VM57_9AGAM|nr:hypothetical protein HYDPIDRAFT_163193 [Hydnomerulius pinastri MD-312]
MPSPANLSPKDFASDMDIIKHQRNLAHNPDTTNAKREQPPNSLCKSCWEGVVANRFGLLLPPVVFPAPREGEPGYEEPGGFVYKISAEEIKSNAADGCHWCRILAPCLSWAVEETKHGSPLDVRVGRNDFCEDDFVARVNEQLVFSGYTYTDEDNIAAPYIGGRSLFLEVGSERAISLTMKLMQQCLNNHDCPSPPHPSPSLPTRVIDCSDPSRPRLLVTNGLRERYVALSYVWGEPQLHSTTTKNIASYMNSIDVDRFPQTLRDAILTTRRLDVRYLWVDSLCIIQDSDEDKVHELSRMRNIYRDSYVTIVAANARRVSEGFLQTRENYVKSDAVDLPFLLPDGSGTGTVYVCDRKDPPQDPVHTRGWCMQELFLSPRVLIFASHTLQYRCPRLTVNIGGADNVDWNPALWQEPDSIRSLPPPDTPEHAKKFREAWRVNVKNYTSRAISVPGDKLIALAALAEEYHDVIRTPYLAGLWERTLLADLLWSRDTDSAALPCPKSYRAPSWSWAAIDGQVSMWDALSAQEEIRDILPSRKKGYLASVAEPGEVYQDPFEGVEESGYATEVIRYEMELQRSEHPFGAVTAGRLDLRALVIECIMLPDDQKTVFRLGSPVDPKTLQDLTIGLQASMEKTEKKKGSTKKKVRNTSKTGGGAVKEEGEDDANDGHNLTYDGDRSEEDDIGAEGDSGSNTGFAREETRYRMHSIGSCILDSLSNADDAESVQPVLVAIIHWSWELFEPTKETLRGLVLKQAPVKSESDKSEGFSGGKRYTRIGFFSGTGCREKVDGWIQHTQRVEIEIV